MQFLKYQQHGNIDYTIVNTNYVQYSKPVKNYPFMSECRDTLKSDEIARAKQLSSQHQAEKKNRGL